MNDAQERLVEFGFGRWEWILDGGERFTIESGFGRWEEWITLFFGCVLR